MGLEIETNGIKVLHPNEDIILILIQSEDKKWQLTTDTHDEKIEKAGWVNLECRTCGGLTREEINNYKELTGDILRQIKQACDAVPNGQWCLPVTSEPPFGRKQLRMLEGQGGSITFFTKKSNSRDSESPYKVLECILRPQLSFSFPINQMSLVFSLLCRYETTAPRVIGAKQEQVSDKAPNYPIQIQIAERKKVVNKFVQMEALSFLNYPQSQNGFCLLFLSYVFDLFILNSEVTVLSETGPKVF